MNDPAQPGAARNARPPARAEDPWQTSRAGKAWRTLWRPFRAGIMNLLPHSRGVAPSWVCCGPFGAGTKRVSDPVMMLESHFLWTSVGFATWRSSWVRR